MGKNEILEVKTSDESTMDLVKSNEIMSLVLQCFGSEDFRKTVEDRSQEFREGAMWGMSYGTMYAITKATHYGARVIEEKSENTLLHYPCQWCGSCPVWLAAYEEGSGLETSGDVLEACQARGCTLVGTPVPEEVLHG